MGEAVRSLAVIGGGKMGEAMLAGWIASAAPEAQGIVADRVFVADPGQDRRGFLERTYGVTCVEDASLLPECDMVVLSVKPQVMMGMLEGISNLPIFSGGQDGPLFVSVAAGLTTQRLESALPQGARVVRVMPNTPLLVGCGASGLCAGSNASDADVETVRGLFDCLGIARVVDESEMDAVCAVSGSGPAYVCAVIEALREAGVAEGLDGKLAEDLALQTVLGTAVMLKQTGQAPDDARKAVCSPGGTTLAALSAMFETGLDDVFASGVKAAAKRSKELSTC